MNRADVVGGAEQSIPKKVADKPPFENRNAYLLRELAGHLEVRRKELSGEIKELIETSKRLQEQSRELRKRTTRHDGNSDGLK